MSEYTHKAVRKEHARILLSITVPANVVDEAYTSNVQEISRTAQIKGFRKGKAPIAVLETKFGTAIRVEATQKIIQKAVPIVLEKVDNKPLPYSYPQLEENEIEQTSDLIITLGSDFTFTISYDTQPEITPADLSQCTIKEHTVKINEQDIEKELMEIQERNATTSDKETSIEAKDIVTFSYVELNDKQEEVKSTARQDYTIIIGEEQDVYNLTPDLLGMKNGEEKIVTKSYPADFHNKAIASKTLTIKIQVTRVREKELPAIDDELAKDVSEKFNTLADLQMHITQQLEDRANHILEELSRQVIVDYLVKHSTMEIPRSAVDLQLDSLWKNFVQQYGGDEKDLTKQLHQSGANKDSLLQMWQQDASIQIQKQLLISKLIETEKIEITDQEVEIQIQEDCEKSGQPFESVLSYYKTNNLMPQLKMDLQQKRLFQILKNLVIIEHGQKFSLTELQEFRQQEQVEANKHEHNT